jgi:Contractile injection system tube protein
LPTQPSINRGTLILLAPNATNASISSKNVYFVFQYNPEKLLHTFNQALPSTLNTNTTDSQGPPDELFYLTFELDSVDIDVSSGNQSSANLGLHPALAMLELMMQPQAVGKQTSMPIVVFKWGAKRSVAVRLVSMSVEEKSFDITLNPTRATVSLTLRVLDASEISNNSGGKSICVSHQKVQATLVDVYKGQTGQATVKSGSSVLGVSGPGGAGSSVESKKKISA